MTQESADATIKRCAIAFDRIRRREEQELRKLCEQPELLDVAQALTDRLRSELTYLCNFHHLVDNAGNKTEITDVIGELQDRLAETFKTLTGKEYRPNVCRDRDADLNARKLLEKIFEEE